MASYIAYIPPPGAQPSGHCSFCLKSIEKSYEKDLNDPQRHPDKKLVAHRNGGDLHPFHKICAKIFHKSNFHECPLCKEACDGSSLYTGKKRIVKWLQQFSKTDHPQNIGVLAFGGAMCMVTYHMMEELTPEQNLIPLIAGSFVGVAGSIGYVDHSLRTAQKFATIATGIVGLVARTNNLFPYPVDQRISNVLGGVVFYNMLVRIKETQEPIIRSFREILSWVTLLTIPVFLEFSEASKDTVMSAKVAVSMAIAMLAIAGTVSIIFLKHVKIPTRRNPIN